MRGGRTQSHLRFRPKMKGRLSPLLSRLSLSPRKDRSPFSSLDVYLTLTNHDRPAKAAGAARPSALLMQAFNMASAAAEDGNKVRAILHCVGVRTLCTQIQLSPDLPLIFCKQRDVGRPAATFRRRPVRSVIDSARWSTHIGCDKRFKWKGWVEEGNKK